MRFFDNRVTACLAIGLLAVGGLALAGCGGAVTNSPPAVTAVAAAAPPPPPTPSDASPAAEPAAQTPADPPPAADPVAGEPPAAAPETEQPSADTGLENAVAAAEPQAAFQPPAGPLKGENPFRDRLRVPEFPANMTWLNTKPLTKKDLQGQVRPARLLDVLLHQLHAHPAGAEEAGAGVSRTTWS